jgi:hypothetical protein
MYTAQQLAAMRSAPDRPRVLTAILYAHDTLLHPTATSTEVMNRVRSGQLEVLFDGTMPAGGGLAPGETPVILGGYGVLGNPFTTPDQILGVMMGVVHEGVHYLDVTAGRARAGGTATVGERFFTELHAYTAEHELAGANGLTHLLAPEFRGAGCLNDIATGVLIVEAQLVDPLRLQPGTEQRAMRAVAAMFPSVPVALP